jgi:hypothetical protein
MHFSNLNRNLSSIRAGTADRPVVFSFKKRRVRKLPSVGTNANIDRKRCKSPPERMPKRGISPQSKCLSFQQFSNTREPSGTDPVNRYFRCDETSTERIVLCEKEFLESSSNFRRAAAMLLHVEAMFRITASISFKRSTMRNGFDT